MLDASRRFLFPFRPTAPLRERGSLPVPFPECCCICGSCRVPDSLLRRIPRALCRARLLPPREQCCVEKSCALAFSLPQSATPPTSGPESGVRHWMALPTPYCTKEPERPCSSNEIPYAGVVARDKLAHDVYQSVLRTRRCDWIELMNCAPMASQYHLSALSVL